MLTSRDAILLEGEAKAAAMELATLKLRFEEKRAAIFANYEREMKVFAAEHAATIARLFTTIHDATDTAASDGWSLDLATTAGQVSLVPVLPIALVQAVMQKAATRPTLQ